MQRVSQASVLVDGNIVGAIGAGLLVFLGVKSADNQSNSEKLAGKVTRLRIFADEAGKMNRSLLDTGGELLIVSQFTLYADTSRGNRPSYAAAADPKLANELYLLFVESCRAQGVRVATGVFQAHMNVKLVNDGPVTILCCSENSPN